MPDGLQIGKSNENTTVFIDFQRIQGSPGGGQDLSEEGLGRVKASVDGGRGATNLNDTNQPRLLLPSYQAARL